MDEDFLDAHQRHWDDAERLYAAKRWANADHLYGFSAECGLKALSEKLKENKLERKEFFHIMESKKPSNAWDIFETYRSGHRLGSKFVMPPSNPFTNWDVSQRYANQINFDQALVEPHRAGAETILKFIAIADKEGLLP
ncbi:hypothetical protein [Methylomonas koyamae]|uniref:Uncharacterized protein n=1 Tax=Methylomonas koyamae TaxID=702114 RepID=A0A291IHV0_9GAMM|nr:hypothetical protein [Methylomonas koyamae]ATG89750.1 hypothetical protein MKLM6_1502 [Methylomonas koyamae]OAI24804.1 hypothetical protein A1356_14900 [Methylomonas koyamae]BBL59302.1 hypothetical protein MKFW12EY_29150 [Methylomonas koyamae]